jgi:hypothetical protein
MSFDRARGTLLSFALVAGCAGHLDHPERFRTDGGGTMCADIPTTLFAPTCARAGCHAAAQPAAGLDLASPDPASRMIGRQAAGGPGLLIDPAMPDNSVILLKVSSSPPFGSRMPLAGTPLDAPTVSCLHDWVVAQVTSSGSDMATPSDGGADSAAPPDQAGSD